MIYNPKDFKLENTSIWSFKERGNWATHKGDYKGNCPPQVPRNLILKYTKENDIVLDPFCGSGTTMVECKLLDRKGIGIDINENALKLAKKRLNFNYKCAYEPKLIKEIIIKEQHNCRMTGYWSNKDIDFYLLAHEYIFILKK